MCLPALHDAQLVEVTHEVVQEWANKLATRLAPSSVQRSFTVLRQVLDFAVDTRALSVNPSTGEGVYHVDNALKRDSSPSTSWRSHRVDNQRTLASDGVVDGVGNIPDRGGERPSTKSISTFTPGGSTLPTMSSRSPASFTRDRRKPGPGDAR